MGFWGNQERDQSPETLNTKPSGLEFAVARGVCWKFEVQKFKTC